MSPDDWSKGRRREEERAALPGMDGGEEGGVGRGGGVFGERRGDLFTAVSLDFCTTHQNSAACRQELWGRADRMCGVYGSCL